MGRLRARKRYSGCPQACCESVVEQDTSVHTCYFTPVAQLYALLVSAITGEQRDHRVLEGTVSTLRL